MKEGDVLVLVQLPANKLMSKPAVSAVARTCVCSRATWFIAPPHGRIHARNNLSDGCHRETYGTPPAPAGRHLRFLQSRFPESQNHIWRKKPCPCWTMGFRHKRQQSLFRPS